MNKDTKDYIIDEAFKLFLNNSYEAVSISIISEAIGLTKGALYHHFTNKEELFKAVIDKHFDIIGVSVPDKNISLEKYTEASIRHARSIMTKIFGDKMDFVPINYLSLIADSFRHYKGFAELKLQFIEDEINNVEVIIKHAITTGEIRKDIDTHIVALQYVSLTLGLAGDLLRNRSINSAMQSMTKQLHQFYKLLKL